MKFTWRWIYHDLVGLRLFLDVHYDTSETCTEEAESFIFALQDIRDNTGAPQNLVGRLGGTRIPPIPEEFKKFIFKDAVRIAGEVGK